MTRKISSATERALGRIASGETPYKAAKAEGLAFSTIYRATKRIRDRIHKKDIAMERKDG
jgi:hypothetical protein